MNTFTRSNATTFTIVHARYLASKISADMHLFAAYYGSPSESHIRNLAEELAQLLKGGYVADYEFGFKKEDAWVVSCRYTIDESGGTTTDDRPGRVVSTVDVTGASFYTYLTKSWKWSQLDESEREDIEKSLPIQRTTADRPGDGNGYRVSDKTYSTNGTSAARSSFRPY